MPSGVHSLSVVCDSTPEAFVPHFSPTPEKNHATLYARNCGFSRLRYGIVVAQGRSFPFGERSEKGFIQEGESSYEEDRSSFSRDTAGGNGIADFGAGAQCQRRRYRGVVHLKVQDVPRRHGRKENG